MRTSLAAISRKSLTLALVVMISSAESLAQIKPKPKIESDTKEAGAIITTRNAMAAARRLSATGWNLRDGVWSGHFAPGTSRLLTLHFLAGVDYVLVGSHREGNGKLQFSLVDSQGKPLPVTPSRVENGLEAIVFKVPEHGRYYLHMSLPSEAGEAAESSVVLLWK